MECAAAMRRGHASETHVRSVLKFDDVNVSAIEPFLRDGDPMIRRMAARVVGKMGSVGLLVDAALEEKDRSVLGAMLRSLEKRSDGLDRLAVFLNDSDSILKEEAISMFRKSGNAECLMLLLFDQDTALVERARRYINEQRDR
jgi:hypothetical protein